MMRDFDIRQALLAELRAVYAGDPETLILDELGLAQAEVRIDLAVVNGLLHGYEIKSPRDTLRRLPTQAAAYSRVFDLLTIVAAERYLADIDAIVPAWWGIATPVREGGKVVLHELRSAARNPDVDGRSIAELLWREEALALLHRRGFAAGLRSKPRRALWDALADALPTDDLAREVRSALRRRSGWRAVPSSA